MSELLDDKAMDRWAEGYIEAYAHDTKSGGEVSDHWAVEKFLDLEADYPGVCWEAILRILKKSPSDIVIGNLAAGPLEELIALHGSDYVDKIELEARRSPVFKEMLRGVWECGAPDVWLRISSARGDGSR